MQTPRTGSQPGSDAEFLTPRLGLIAALILAATLLRLLPHPWNVAPVGALALFGGARLPRAGWAFGLPLAAMLVSDGARWWFSGTGLHALSPAVYLALAAVVLLGRGLRARPGGWIVAGGAPAGALLFYLVTNLAVWAQLGSYPLTWAGLVACYVAGLPLLGHTVAGDLIYATALFGGLALAGRGWPRLAAGPAVSVLLALLLLPSVAWAQDSAPIAAIGRVAVLGDVPRGERQLAANRLQADLSQNYRIVSDAEYLRAEEEAFATLETESCTEAACVRAIQEYLQLDRLFVLQLIRQEGVTQLTLTLFRGDERHTVEEVCNDCTIPRLLENVDAVASRISEQDLGRRIATVSAAPLVESGPVVVSANRMETPAAQVGSSVTVIGGEELERRQTRSVVEALRGVPGLDVVRSGGPGRLSSVFLRGAESDHTLVLVDGIVVNDPMFNRAVDLSDLAALDIERIEVLRGPQGTLYGSNAIGGVIHIFTRRGAGPTRTTASAEAGSFNTFNADAAVSGGGETFQYSVAGSRQSTAGISAASEHRGHSERDGFQSDTVSAQLGYTPVEALAIDLVLRAVDSEQDLDEDYGLGIEDDPNFSGEIEQRHLRLQGTLDLFAGAWSQTLGHSRSTHERRSTNKPDGTHPDDSSRSVTESDLRATDWQHTLRLHERNTLVLGLVTQEERGRSRFESASVFGPFESRIPEESARTDSLYAEDRLSFGETLFATLGVRVDDHERFGEEQTKRVTLAAILPSRTTFRASYGTGFKAPTLFDLFSPDFGNPDLEPERSTGWDAGVEQVFQDGAWVIGLTYFRNTYDNLISFDPVTFQSVNVDEAESYGAELILTARPAEALAFTLAATRTETEDKSTGNRLLRRPRDKASLGADLQPGGPLGLRLDVLHVGERDDLDFSVFPAERVTLDAYTVVNLAAGYDPARWLRLFGRVENLFDEEYEEVLGFGTAGRAGYAGARVTF